MMDIDKMNCFRIIIPLLIAATIWATAGQAMAWTRHGLNRYGFDGRYDPHHSFFHPWYHGHGHPGDIHGYGSRYKDIYNEQDGWDMLKKYRSNTALEIFEDLSGETPAAGAHKLGIAIAAADTGQLPKSVTAMRLALRYNPGALQLFEPEDWLKDRLKKLVKKYQGQFHGLQNQDAYFMRIAFYYILKDKEACFEAIRYGKKTNDTSDSALNLYYMAENDEWKFH